MNSLRYRFAALFVLVAIVGSVSIGIWSYLAAADRLSTETDRTLSNAASLSRSQPDHDRDNDSLGSSQSTTAATLADREQVVTQRLAPDGSVTIPVTGVSVPVDGTDRAIAAGTAKERRRDVEIDGLPFRILTFHADEHGGAVQVIVSTAVTDRVLDKLRELIAAATLVFIVLAAVAGWLIGWRLTVRLTRLASAAETVATTGRLDVEVPADGKDEAGRLASAFGAMLAALAAAKESQQRLVQDAGHELRTPLTSLRTNIGVLRRHHSDLDDEARTQILDDLEVESRELTTLVNEVVALASDSTTDESAGDVVLAPIVERAAERTGRRYGCDVVVQADDSVVVARPSAVERAVANLLDNAAKFGAADGPIDVHVRRGSVEVLDRGPGIDPEDLPHVFDRFFRATAARSMPGSGLGLAIVRDMAESSGGEVFAENRAGGGARLGFTLPVRPAAT